MSDSSSHSTIKKGALTALLLGGIGIAFAPVLAKLAINVDQRPHQPLGQEILSPTAVAFWRMAIGTPIFVAMSWLGSRPRDMISGVRDCGWKIITPGLFFALDLGLWHWSFEFTSVAKSTLLVNFAVIIVAAFGWIFRGERFGLLFGGGALLSLAGMMGLVGVPSEESSQAWIGDLMGFAVAFAYAGYQISTKSLVRKLPVPVLMTMSTGICAVFLGIGSLFSPGRFFPITIEGWGVLIALTIIAQVFGQGLIAYGIRYLPSSLAAVALIIQPVGAALLGWMILGQSLTGGQIVAGLVVLTGIFLARLGQLPLVQDQQPM